MYNAKHTMLYRHKVHDGQAHVFYMDIRAGGKNYDEFVRRAIEQDGAQYHRGRVSKITEENGKLIVRGVDTLAGVPLTIAADMVVLAARDGPGRRSPTAGPETERRLRRARLSFRIAPQAAARGNQLGRRLRLRSLPGAEGHSRIGGAGVGGRRQSAGDVRPGSAPPRTGNRPSRSATVRGCFACVRACPITPSPPGSARRSGTDRRVAEVNAGLCMGCGTCVAVCPSKSADLAGFSEQQIYAVVESLA